MPHEQLDPRTMMPVTTVVWGPFPLRRARLAGGLALVMLAAMMLVLGLQRQVLTCARSGPLANQCEWQRGLSASTVRRFPLSSLQSVRVAYSETSHKGRTTRWGQVVLSSGSRELTLVREKAAAANANAAMLQTFLHDVAIPQVRIETERTLSMLGLGGAFAAAGIALLYSVWFGRRRFLFSWDVSTKQLTMQTQGPLGRVADTSSCWSLREPVEVEVRWEEVKDFFTSSRSPGPRGGRLQVRLADGNVEALLPQPMPGYAVHLRAAEQLRHLLRCPLPSPAQAARSAADQEAARPKLGPGWTGIPGRIAATWIGACCGSLVGITIGGILALALGFAKASDNAGGPWFFGGMIGGAVAGVVLAWRLLLRPDER